MPDEPGEDATGFSADDWERLLGGEGPPPPPRGGAMPDLGAVLALVEGLRGAVPPELQQQVSALARELLLTLRALIDWQLERLEQRPSEPRVEDIPLD